MLTPQQEYDRLLALVRQARDLLAEGKDLPPDLVGIVAWAREWKPAALHECACGKLIHTTHRGAAQHAAALVLVEGRSGKQLVYQCRANPRALHVGRK